MNPEQYELRQYCQIPIMTDEQVTELIKTGNIVMLYNLVVDCSQFDHPGSNNVFNSLKNREATQTFLLIKHSFNADLIACHNTIGRLLSPRSQGQIFYNKIKFSQLNIAHEDILCKLDFQRPLYDTLSFLSLKQLAILTEIPKIFKNPDKKRLIKCVTFKQRLNQMQDAIFGIWFFLILSILVFSSMWISYSYIQILKNIVFIPIGLLKWTLLEYFYHRYDYHHDIVKTKYFTGADLHHCFPNLKQQISINIQGIILPFVVIISVLYIFFDVIQLGMISIGVFLGLGFHNFMHHICHSGIDINIQWIRRLKLHHHRHHFIDQNAFFGISSSFWDAIFRTNQNTKLVT